MGVPVVLCSVTGFCVFWRCGRGSGTQRGAAAEQLQESASGIWQLLKFTIAFLFTQQILLANENKWGCSGCRYANMQLWGKLWFKLGNCHILTQCLIAALNWMPPLPCRPVASILSKVIARPWTVTVEELLCCQFVPLSRVVWQTRKKNLKKGGILWALARVQVQALFCNPADRASLKPVKKSQYQCRRPVVIVSTMSN